MICSHTALMQESHFDMKPDKLYLELEEIIERLGYKVRKERGNFKGGYCVLEGEKILMVNKNHTPDIQAGMLGRFLQEQDGIEDMFIKPAVRKELAQIWYKKKQTADRKNPLLENINQE